MKTKIISLLLIISFLASMLTVFSFAAEEGSDVNYTTEYLHYQNSFGDKANDVGGEKALSNAENSSYEIRTESDNNHYGYYEFNDANKNVFMEFTPKEEYNIGSDKLGYLIFEFDFNDFGKSVTTSKFLDVNSGKGSFAPNGGRVPASDILNVGNDSQGNFFYFRNDKTQKIYFNHNEWVHVRCEFSVLSTSATQYNLRCYIGDRYFESAFDLGTPQLIYQIRLGSTNTTNQCFGLDNITIYSTPTNGNVPTGTLLTMKVGAENASMGGRVIELAHVPLLINNEVYCPLDILENIAGKEASAEYVLTIDGAEYIHISNVKPALRISAKSYAMGLIMVGNEIDFISESTSYDGIANLMKSFIFNIPSADQLKTDVYENTNGYDHPFLVADADRFEELRAIYTKGNAATLTTDEERQLYDYINGYISSAKSTYQKYCGNSDTATYNGISNGKIPVNSNYNNYNNNGYDNGGRLNIDTTPLLYFAFAYQMTGNLNYARATYDYMMYMGEW